MTRAAQHPDGPLLDRDHLALLVDALEHSGRPEPLQPDLVETLTAGVLARCFPSIEGVPQ